jgi:DNA-binding winged helix-turn-helix (wHTH) protein
MSRRHPVKSGGLLLPYIPTLLLDEELVEIRGPFDRFPRQHLTPHEFRCLRRLTRARGVVTDWQLQEAIWLEGYEPTDYREQVKGLIFSLRQKLRAAGWGEADIIITKPGHGRYLSNEAILLRLNAIADADNTIGATLVTGVKPPPATDETGEPVPPPSSVSSQRPASSEADAPKD